MEERIKEYLIYLSDVKYASKNTINSYAGDLKQFTQFLRDLHINQYDEITETNVNSFLLGLERSGMSPASINRKLVTIKSFILFGIKKGFIQEDPTERIKPPKYEKKNPNFISVEQMNALLNAPDLTTPRGIRDKAMLELLYATGMKVSELVALRLEDVVSKLMYVIVREKTGERVLPYGNAAKNAL